MLGMLGFGLLLLLVKWHRLMFISFACCGLLCLFLKRSTNTSLTYAQPKQTEIISVSHVNISNHDGDYKELADILRTLDSDLISIQEVTPDWDAVLKQELRDSFPYRETVASIGFNGMAVFSKIPIENVEVFYYKDIPNISGFVRPGSGEPVQFITTYTNPVFDTEGFYQELREHFTTIINKVGKYKTSSKIAIGTYNTVAWSSEMKYFTSMLNLQNSRRPNNPFAESAYEHIFHSSDLECTDLHQLNSPEGKKLGISGTFQFSGRVIEENDKG